MPCNSRPEATARRGLAPRHARLPTESPSARFRRSKATASPGSPSGKPSSLFGMSLSPRHLAPPHRLRRSHWFTILKGFALRRMSSHWPRNALAPIAIALDTVSLVASHLAAAGAEGDPQSFATFLTPALEDHSYIQAFEWIHGLPQHRGRHSNGSSGQKECRISMSPSYRKTEHLKSRDDGMNTFQCFMPPP
jgi:hypothetical protein